MFGGRCPLITCIKNALRKKNKFTKLFGNVYFDMARRGVD